MPRIPTLTAAALFALAATPCRGPAAQERPTEPLPTVRRLRQTLDDALRTGDPAPARQLVDELGVDAAPLVPMLHEELEREDPRTWLTARAILARASAFHAPGRLTRSFPVDGVLLGTLNAKTQARGEPPVSSAGFRRTAAGLAAEQEGRAKIDPHGDPSTWVAGIRALDDPFAVELAADLLRRRGVRDPSAAEALAFRIREGTDDGYPGPGGPAQSVPALYRSIARALLVVGPDRPEASEALGSLAFDSWSTENERTRARTALRQLGPGAEGAIASMQRALSGEAPFETLQSALELAAGLAERGLPLVPTLEGLATALPPDHEVAAQARAAAATIRGHAIRHSLSPRAPDRVGERGLAMRRQIDAQLDELFSTEDPDRFDELLERTAALGPITTQALIDRALSAPRAGRKTSLARLGLNRDVVRLMARLGPAAEPGVRRLLREIERTPPDLALDLVSLLTRWLPWCQPFDAAAFPLVEGDRLRLLVVRTNLPSRVDEVGGFEHALTHRGIDRELVADPMPLHSRSELAALRASLDSRSSTEVVLAAEALRERDTLDPSILTALEVRARARDLDRYRNQGHSIARLADCQGAAGWALMAHAPAALDTMEEIDGLLRVQDRSRQETTRIIRRLEELRREIPAATREWSTELLMRAWPDPAGPAAPTLRTAILRALAVDAPLDAETLQRVERLLEKGPAESTEAESRLLERLRGTRP